MELNLVLDTGRIAPLVRGKLITTSTDLAQLVMAWLNVCCHMFNFAQQNKSIFTQHSRAAWPMAAWFN
jgi:hypothetical protein